MPFISKPPTIRLMKTYVVMLGFAGSENDLGAVKSGCQTNKGDRKTKGGPMEESIASIRRASC